MSFLGVENILEFTFLNSDRSRQRRIDTGNGIKEGGHLITSQWFMWCSVHAADMFHAPLSVVACLPTYRMCTTDSRDKKNTYIYRLPCKHTRCTPRSNQQQCKRACGLQSVVNGRRGMWGWRPRRWESCTLSGFGPTKSNCIIQHWSTVLRPVNYA